MYTKYDSKGNPTVYRNNALTWSRVRLLASYGNNTFAYNADGIRVRKNNTTYALDGSNIIKESRNGNDIVYYYDETGVCGFCYNGKNYFYVKNLQGDIKDIYDEYKVKCAEYVYDAWGNHTITVDVDGIGTLNPFRYRSYYYDTETGLYYLKSRYYDPEVGRFISQDELLDQRSILGYNLYTYCLNNPVNMRDNEGNSPTAVLTTVGAVLAALGKAIVATAYVVLAAVIVVASAALVYEVYEAKTKEHKSAISRADSKIRETVTQKSKTRYWTATLHKDYVDIGRALTYTQAVEEVANGRNVFTVTWYEAKAVALAAGGDSGANNHKLYPEIDKGKENTPGYYFHYHTYNRKGGHVYYLF